MKHFMQPRNPILKENHENLPFQSPNPNSSKNKGSRKQKWSNENATPSDLNSMAAVPLSYQKSSPAAKMKSPLPPRPPNSLKRKLIMETVPENAVPGSFDSGVKVIVRMRPPKKDEDGETIIQKISDDSLTINGQTFTFDSVADTEATQLDIYQLVGAPLVENCLAGFNSSVFAYGQTGSGKTYTMWGPANAMLEENFSTAQQGLTPRVFEQLFARISQEQIKHADKQLEYQCRCSFLEIYNEQITDLLDPNQKSLQIREDVKSGVYVEDLTEECVFTTKDVTQLLIKGLSNRRTGATSINAESSRSHSVFTFVLESRCKSKADGLRSFKTSRINLVDLAGSERQKLTGAAGERLKEAGNINRSLSQLGNLINILAEVSQTGKQRHIPYRDSRLTFLLQESLGGNAKLAMVCAISPAQSCRSETFSTLRFAQRAKAIKNKAIVNEVAHEDVNSLREVIRQLKDELIRIKANGNKPSDINVGFARRSLNLLKLSLNRPMMLPHVEHDSDEEMEIDEEAVENVSVPIRVCQVESVKSNFHLDDYKDGCVGESQSNTSYACIKEQGSEDTDVIMEEEIYEQIDKDEIITLKCGEPRNGTPHCNILGENEKENPVLTLRREPSLQLSEEKKMPWSSTKLPSAEPSSKIVENGSSCPVSDFPNDLGNCISPSSLSIVPCDVSPPTLSVSPRISYNSRKSLRISSTLTASQKDLQDDSKLGHEAIHLSFAKSIKGTKLNVMSAKRSKNLLPPTEHLAASLHRGLEIIDSHRQTSALRQSSFRFSYKPSDSKLIFPVGKVDVGAQTFLEDVEMLKEDSRLFLCSNCKGRAQLEAEEAHDSLNLQLVPVDGESVEKSEQQVHKAREKVLTKEDHDSSNLQLVPVDGESVEKSRQPVPKAVEKVLAGSFRREMALEELCAKQNAEIMQLNRLMQQFKHERECSAILGQTREDKILRLESLVDGILPTEVFMEEEFVSLTNEHKLLKEKYENNPEVLKTKIELKRVQDELEGYQNFFDMGEREVLLEEIQNLRSQLQYYTDSSSMPMLRRSSLLKLTYPSEANLAPPLSTIPESTVKSAEQKLKQEKIRWIEEEESKWISLAEELRMELEASRCLAKKQKQELDTEKKCAEELKEAMQMAMQGHARLLEQYADLEEKHMQMLARHRRIQEGIDDVKKAAARAGVRGAESKFINALAAEISALKVEREKERRYLRDENKGLQAQLRDTAEAVQAAGELLVRLKEAEEAIAAAQTRAMEAEQEAVNAFKMIDALKNRHENEISALNQCLAESRLPKEALQPACDDDSYSTKYDLADPNGADDQQWKEEFRLFCNAEDGDLSKLEEPSWFSGYDRCNI